MEIKLKENSNIIIKNHYGDTLCSIDEATGKITKNGVDVATTDEAFNVINANQIVNNKLTQDQFRLITNGKPTRVVGTLLNRTNILFISGGVGTSTARFIGISSTLVETFSINISTKVITRDPSASGYTQLQNIADFNGKTVPVYPINNAKQYKFVQKVGGDLDYVEDIDSTTEITRSDVLASLPTGLACRVSDSRITRQNKEVKLTMRLAIENEIALPVSVGNLNSFIINIPDVYSSRIRDMKGVLLNTTGESGVGITASICYSDNGDSQFYYINRLLAIKRASTNANQLQLQIIGMSSINPHTTHNFLINVSFPLID